MVQRKASFVWRLGPKRLLAWIHLSSFSFLFCRRPRVRARVPIIPGRGLVGKSRDSVVSQMQAQEPELEMWPWDDGDREEGEEWFTPRPFEAAAAAEEYSLEDYEATAVIHPFGRGQFRTVAMHVVIPPIVLDEFLKGKDRRSLWTWPDDDDEHIETKKYSTASAAANVNCEEWVPKAHTSSSKMGGVKSPSPLPGSSLHSHVGGSCGAVGRGRGMPNRGMGAETRVVKAKVSGRGRAMRTRAEIGRIPLRKPVSPL